jgi:hypothetical protein
LQDEYTYDVEDDENGPDLIWYIHQRQCNAIFCTLNKIILEGLVLNGNGGFNDPFHFVNEQSCEVVNLCVHVTIMKAVHSL